MSDMYILLSVVVLGLLVLFLALFVKKKEKREVDYKNFFVMGVIWLAFGIGYPLLFGRPFELNGLISMGIIFTAVGLANKDKWGKKVEAPLSQNQKLVLLGLVLVTLIAVAITFYVGSLA